MVMAQSDPDTVTCTLGEAYALVKAMVSIRRPVLLTGAPGIGKSEWITELAADLNRKLFDGLRASMLDAVDVRGMPVPDIVANLTRWIPPAFFPRDADGPSILFLDELTRGNTLVMNALMSLSIPPFKAGEYTLPDQCSIIAATNRDIDGSGLFKMPKALANRYLHLNIVVDVDEWIGWAYDHSIEPIVIAFIRSRPKLLNVVDPDKTQPRRMGTAQANPEMLEYITYDPKMMAFPTPRSVAGVSAIVAQHLPDRQEYLGITGTVGREWAVQFAAFAPIYRTLSAGIDYVIDHPDTAPVPGSDKLMERYALASALAHYATEDNLGNIITYLGRPEWPGEYGAFAMHDMTRRDPSLQQTSEYTAWFAKARARQRAA